MVEYAPGPNFFTTTQCEYIKVYNAFWVTGRRIKLICCMYVRLFNTRIHLLFLSGSTIKYRQRVLNIFVYALCVLSILRLLTTHRVFNLLVFVVELFAFLCNKKYCNPGKFKFLNFCANIRFGHT